MRRDDYSKGVHTFAVATGSASGLGAGVGFLAAAFAFLLGGAFFHRADMPPLLLPPLPPAAALPAVGAASAGHDMSEFGEQLEDEG